LFADNLPIIQFNVNELAWILEWDTPDPIRIRSADLSAPILVTTWQEKFVVLDGLHRLAKAVYQSEKYIYGKYIPNEVMPIFKINTNQQNQYQ
jgi:hypothetical protein